MFKRKGGGGDTRIPVGIVSLYEIISVNPGFPSLLNKPSDPKYSSLTPALPLNYTQTLPTTEHNRNPYKSAWYSSRKSCPAATACRQTERYYPTTTQQNQTCRAHTASASERNATQEKCAPHKPRDRWRRGGEGG